MDIAELKSALDNSCLDIDKFSGNCQLRLPMGELLGQLNGMPLKLELTGQLQDSSKLPVLNFYNVGTWRMSGGSSYDKYEIHVSDVPLANGNSMNADTDDKGSHTAVGPGYVFDATHILTKRKEAFKDTIDEFQQKPLKGQTFTVMHSTGMAEIFDCVGERTKGASEPPLVLTREILESNGKGLKFTWHTENGDARVTKIQDSIGTVLTARWDWSDKRAPTLSQLILYPDSQEAVQYDCRYEADALEVSLTKQHPFIEKIVHRLETGADRINLKTTTHYKTKNSDTSTSEIDFSRQITEVLTWEGDNTKTHVIQLPDSAARLKRTWKWQKNVTHITLLSEQLPPAQTSEAKTIAQPKPYVETLEDVTYEHSDGIISRVESKSQGSTSLLTCEVTTDPKARTSTSCVVQALDGVEISRTESTFNAEGNLIELKRGDEKIQWTYFNNYTHYSTTSEITNDASSIVKAMGIVIAPGLGTNPAIERLNFASNTVREFTAFRSSAPNNYAKNSFNLPLDINYPGDELGFSNHIESERATQVNTEGETTTRITYFGYDKVRTVPNDLIDRNHVVVLARKLTVLMPKVTLISVTQAQREIADKSIEQMVSALKVCINSVKNDEYLREGYESSMAAIKNAAKAQSEMNDKGYRLDSWQNVQMTVEDFTYDTAPTSAHFCKLLSSTVYSLDEAGNKIENSAVNTRLSHVTNSKTPRRITTNTLVTSSSETLATSYVQEGFTQKLVEQTNAAGMKKYYSYANGALSTATITQGESVLSKINIGYTIDAKKRTFQIQTHDENGLNRRTVLDERGRIRSEWTNMTGGENAWRQSSEKAYTEDGGTLTKYVYDTQGKQHPLSVEHFDTDGNSNQLFEYDYDALGNVFDVRTTKWSTDLNNDTTKTVVMKSGDGTVLDTRTQTIQGKDSGIVIQQGTFTETYHWDAKQRRAHYSNGNEGAAETLQLTIDHDARGQPIRTQYSKQVGGKSINIALHTAEYNIHGSPLKIAADSSPPVTFEYDPRGRLTKKEKDGAVLLYEYENDSASPTPISMSMLQVNKKGEPEHEATPTVLGKQTLDAWGRVIKQTVNDIARNYTYTGASTVAYSKPPRINSLFEGYTQTWNSSDRTYTESCAYAAKASESGSQTLSTKSELSLRGRLIRMTDIAGQDTAYTYDALNRVIKQDNPACITTAVFTDDGRLQSETVEDVTSKRVMSISYSYDVLGREIERRFTSDGMAPIVLRRELSPAGRLVKHCLNVGGKPKYVDDYQYNPRGQLVAWNGNGRPIAVNGQKFYQETYGYDAIGNMTTYGVAADKHEKISSQPRELSAAMPGLVLKARGFSLPNKNGRLTQSISYSSDGRVSHTSWPVSYSQKAPNLYFKYDPTGRVRALFTSGGNDAGRGFQLHYRGDKVYARSQKTTHGAFWNGTLEKTDILINESGGCTLRQTCAKDKNDQKSVDTSFELRDSSGTIFATVKADGTLSAWHVYSPYGYRQVDNEWENWLGFKGEVIYPRSFYYLGHYRVYDPNVMAFCSPDDKSPFGIGGPATYAFCAGDPVNYHDPSGHTRVSHLSAVVAPPIMTTREFQLVVAVGSILTAPIGGGAIATMLGVVSGGLELASVLVEDSDPELASALNVLSFGTGMGSVAAGLNGASRLTGAASRGMVRTRAVLDRTMAGVDGYRYIDDSMRLWQDTHKGVKRLVVDIHGVADDAGKAVGRVATSAGGLDATEFLEYLAKKGVNIDDYGKIKMHSCYSASHHNSFGDSFAKDLARVTKKEVKGYQGKMSLSRLLGERAPGHNGLVDDPRIYDLLSTETGKAELLEAWRPRKIDWVRDINGVPVLDSNGAAMLQQYKDFKPVTYRPRPDSWQIDEIIGDHSYEKVIKRFNKNPNVYSDPYEEIKRFQKRQDGTLLEYLLDGDSLC